jgi:hypothetical protein
MYFISFGCRRDREEVRIQAQLWEHLFPTAGISAGTDIISA